MRKKDTMQKLDLFYDKRIAQELHTRQMIDGPSESDFGLAYPCQTELC